MTAVSTFDATTYGVFDGPCPPAAAADTSKPVVTLVSPAADDPFDKDVPIVFDVTDDSGVFEHIEVRMNFDNGSCETAYGTGINKPGDNDSNYKPFYRAVSTVTPIAGGFRFSVRRLLGGYPSSPTLEVDAIDTSGNRAV